MTTEAEAVAELVGQPVVLQTEADGLLALAVPQGWQQILNDLERYAQTPRRSRGDTLVYDAESFVSSVQRRSGDNSTTVYGDEQMSALTAILNDDDAAGDPGWRDYRVSLYLRPTPEWAAWQGGDGHWYEQVDFANFIEDHLAEIQEPSAADMLEIAQVFEATTTAAFKSANRLSSGATQFRYEEDVEANAGTLEIPSEIVLALTPFIGSPRYEVSARFRYRLGRGHLSLGYKLDRPVEVMRAAFADVKAKVIEGLPGYEIVNGQAPASVVASGGY